MEAGQCRILQAPDSAVAFLNGVRLVGNPQVMAGDIVEFGCCSMHVEGDRPPPRYSLVYQEPDSKYPSHLDLSDGNYLLGTGRASALQLSAEGCSRRHCLIRVQGDQLYIRDLNSVNGVQVNGERLGQDEVPLALGAPIALGRCNLLIVKQTEAAKFLRRRALLSPLSDRRIWYIALAFPCLLLALFLLARQPQKKTVDEAKHIPARERTTWRKVMEAAVAQLRNGRINDATTTIHGYRPTVAERAAYDRFADALRCEREASALLAGLATQAASAPVELLDFLRTDRADREVARWSKATDRAEELASNYKGMIDSDATEFPADVFSNAGKLVPASGEYRRKLTSWNLLVRTVRTPFRRHEWDALQQNVDTAETKETARQVGLDLSPLLQIGVARRCIALLDQPDAGSVYDHDACRRTLAKAASATAELKALDDSLYESLEERVTRHREDLLAFDRARKALSEWTADVPSSTRKDATLAAWEALPAKYRGERYPLRAPFREAYDRYLQAVLADLEKALPSLTLGEQLRRTTALANQFRTEQAETFSPTAAERLSAITDRLAQQSETECASLRTTYEREDDPGKRAKLLERVGEICPPNSKWSRWVEYQKRLLR
jgi:hypothetical protein